jgi:hypothetical protein
MAHKEHCRNSLILDSCRPQRRFEHMCNTSSPLPDSICVSSPALNHSTINLFAMVGWPPLPGSVGPKREPLWSRASAISRALARATSLRPSCVSRSTPYPSCMQNPSSLRAITCPRDAACAHRWVAPCMSLLSSPAPLPLNMMTAIA